jgi:hypothetical protein
MTLMIVYKRTVGSVTCERQVIVDGVEEDGVSEVGDLLVLILDRCRGEVKNEG